ncbi:hypothetical protein ABZ949_02055 [Micromonospora tulbaghiae]
MGARQEQAPGADLRRGTVTYDPKAGEWVADHSTTVARPLRPFAPRGNR